MLYHNECGMAVRALLHNPPHATLVTRSHHVWPHPNSPTPQTPQTPRTPELLKLQVGVRSLEEASAARQSGADALLVKAELLASYGKDVRALGNALEYAVTLDD